MDFNPAKMLRQAALDLTDARNHRSLWIYIKLSSNFGTRSERDFCSKVAASLERFISDMRLGEREGSGFGFGYGDVSFVCDDPAVTLQAITPVLKLAGLPKGSYAEASVGSRILQKVTF